MPTRRLRAAAASEYGLGANIYTQNLTWALTRDAGDQGRHVLDQRPADRQRRRAVRRDAQERHGARARRGGARRVPRDQARAPRLRARAEGVLVSVPPSAARRSPSDASRHGPASPSSAGPARWAASSSATWRKRRRAASTSSSPIATCAGARRLSRRLAAARACCRSRCRRPGRHSRERCRARA